MLRRVNGNVGFIICMKKDFDLDGNRQITYEEVLHVLKYADKNQDNIVSVNEFPNINSDYPYFGERKVTIQSKCDCSKQQNPFVFNNYDNNGFIKPTAE